MVFHPRTDLPDQDRAARSRLVQLLTSGARLLDVNVVDMPRVCGKPTCRCARGEKHVSLYLSARVGRRRAMIYVPRWLEGAAREWAANGQAARRWLKAVAQANLDDLLEQKKKRSRRAGCGSAPPGP